MLLLLGSRRRREVALAIGAVAAATALLAPIALQQAANAHAGWIAEQPLGQRLERAGAKLVGDDNGNEHGARQPGPIPLGVPAALAIAALALLLWRGDPDERSGAGVAALVGGVALALPLLLGLLGADYFDGRNLLPVFVPLIVVLGAGFGVRRAGWAGLGLAGAFCLCSLVFTIEIDRLPRLQREDLRNAAKEVGPRGPDRRGGDDPLRRQPARCCTTSGPVSPHGPLPPLREIDLVGSGIAAEKSARRLLPPAFHRVESKPVSYNFTLTRLRSSRPIRVPFPRLGAGCAGRRWPLLLGADLAFGFGLNGCRALMLE